MGTKEEDEHMHGSSTICIQQPDGWTAQGAHGEGEEEGRREGATLEEQELFFCFYEHLV